MVDTVADTAQDKTLPYRELGLTDAEYEQIRELLGRRPTASELAIYSVMWSEHCSYKSSRRHLRQLGEGLTERMREHLMVGIGQNAGVVDIGGGWAVTFKAESHNHPSYVEPFQGAATGVGGIVRDIISMGARPVALMDMLRFGAVSDPDTARVARGVVSGISFYGNCLGLPNIGGETVFDPVYQGNPLVNVLCAGVLRHEDLRLANATGTGNLVVLFGAPTGGDGIGGASILASDAFSSEGETKRPAVQVGDPFTEKVLIECCLELYAQNLVVAIQDLGAAGISCATSELSHNGGVGMRVQLDKVPLRDPGLSPEEILMSESQERMMAIVTPESLERFLEVTSRWEIPAAVIGVVDDSKRLMIDWQGKRIVDIDPDTIVGPAYERECVRPEYLERTRANTADNLPRTEDPDQLRQDILAVISSPNLSDKSIITQQYDRYVQGNTALSHPDDAGVIRVYDQVGIALACDGNSKYSYLDPYAGVQLALAESYRNVAAAGARPVAVTNCLNFGNPEKPEVMWQFAETCRGLADACRELEVPVTGGNVSFYNQTDEQQIFPTPVVGVLGVIDDVSAAVPSGWNQPGLQLYLLGSTALELGGSAWAQVLYRQIGGQPPRVDLAREKRLAQLLVAGVAGGVFAAVHDLSEGGLIQTLTESVLRFDTGARISLDEVGGVDLTAALFSESAGRALVAVSDPNALRQLCQQYDYECAFLGETIAEPELIISAVARFDLDELRQARAEAMDKLFNS